MQATEKMFFTFELHLKETILVVDDDPGLREQWRLILKEQGIHTLLCDSYEDVVRQNISSALTTTAIIDYHFENSEKNGVEIVKYLQNIGFKTLCLCTAEYWKPQLQRISKEMGVPICPKPIPKINVVFPKECGSGSQTSLEAGYNVLVIDDETSIHMSWELLQKKLKIANLHCYANLEGLQLNDLDFSTINIAFVDKNFPASQFQGKDVVSFLKKNGISKVVLASGEQTDTLRNNPDFSQVDYFLQQKVPTDREFKAFLM